MSKKLTPPPLLFVFWLLIYLGASFHYRAVLPRRSYRGINLKQDGYDENADERHDAMVQFNDLKLEIAAVIAPTTVCSMQAKRLDYIYCIALTNQFIDRLKGLEQMNNDLLYCWSHLIVMSLTLRSSLEQHESSMNFNQRFDHCLLPPSKNTNLDDVIEIGLPKDNCQQLIAPRQCDSRLSKTENSLEALVRNQTKDLSDFYSEIDCGTPLIATDQDNRFFLALLFVSIEVSIKDMNEAIKKDDCHIADGALRHYARLIIMLVDLSVICEQQSIVAKDKLFLMYSSLFFNNALQADGLSKYIISPQMIDRSY